MATVDDVVAAGVAAADADDGVPLEAVDAVVPATGEDDSSHPPADDPIRVA